MFGITCYNMDAVRCINYSNNTNQRFVFAFHFDKISKFADENLNFEIKLLNWEQHAHFPG